jgi:hypothetical protein
VTHASSVRSPAPSAGPPVASHSRGQISIF